MGLVYEVYHGSGILRRDLALWRVLQHGANARDAGEYSQSHEGVRVVAMSEGRAMKKKSE
jgi:hypothetical protein